MNYYIQNLFNSTNTNKLNQIKSSPDTYRSVSNILINKIFFDIIKDNISEDKKREDIITYEKIEKDIINILIKKREGIITDKKSEKYSTKFMKLSFNQAELIKYLIDSFDNISNLGKIANKKGGITKLQDMYKDKIELILGIKESSEEIKENFNYITNDLNSIFRLPNVGLKNYREEIKKIDKAIDDFDGPMNKTYLQDIFSEIFNDKISIEDDKITLKLGDQKLSGELKKDQKIKLEKKLEVLKKQVTLLNNALGKSKIDEGSTN